MSKVQTRETGRQPWINRQPIVQAGEQVPEDIRNQEEIDVAREWLRHVEAGRIGTHSHAGVHGEHDDAKLG